MARIAKQKKDVFLNNAKKALETAVTEKIFLRVAGNYYFDFEHTKIIECDPLYLAIDYGVLFYRAWTARLNRSLDEVMNGQKSIEDACNSLAFYLDSH
ncbi:hypothetical protein ACFVS2_26705 [Brevibacillus sp. NPDC058079]|uniref:hypothetical protein n=1 Tax=Brevibacillus sp. NPDC058079 TaxID=3346330 RepID=UPI0036E29407